MVEGTLTSPYAEGAQVILSQFDSYYQDFRAITRRADLRFRERQWQGVMGDAVERLQSYRLVIDEMADLLRGILGPEAEDRTAWMLLRTAYLSSLGTRSDGDLALTFFYSVMRRVLRDGGYAVEYADDGIIDRSDAVSSEITRSYVYSDYADGVALVRAMLESTGFGELFEDLDADAVISARRIEDELYGVFHIGSYESIEVLKPIFFRNKGAYIVGQVHAGALTIPLALAVLNRDDGRGIIVDAVLRGQEDMTSLLFTSTRSSFQIDSDSYRDVVDFLERLAPRRGRPALYAAIGFTHPAKVLLNQMLRQHMSESAEVFTPPPGRQGTVMIVFGVPSFPYVLKVVRDRSRKESFVSRERVIEKYQLVHEADRVGRMLDPWVYTNLPFQRRMFDPELLAQIMDEAPNSVQVDGDEVLLRHVYVQRRVTPLQLYLMNDDISLERRHEVTKDYGHAIKDLLAAGILPEYVEFNFGVTQEGRAVLYDFDDLQRLDQVTIRDLPDYEDETLLPDLIRLVPRVPGTDNLFPQMYEYEARMIGIPPFAETFDQMHHDLYEPDFWRLVQQQYLAGTVGDSFPYPQERRLQPGRHSAVSVLGRAVQVDPTLPNGA